MKHKILTNNTKILWWIQIVVAGMYLLAAFTVDANMQLPNLSYKTSAFVIAGLTALGALDAILLLLTDKKRRWISLLLLLLYLFFSAPVFA